MRKYICSTPQANCVGSLCAVTQGTGRMQKLHDSPQQAFKCYKNYLIKQGYVQVGSKEFQKDGGPVLVLTRPGKYGGVFRKGKSGDSSGSKNRVTPKNKNGTTSGMIY